MHKLMGVNSRDSLFICDDGAVVILVTNFRLQIDKHSVRDFELMAFGVESVKYLLEAHIRIVRVCLRACYLEADCMNFVADSNSSTMTSSVR